MTSERPMSHAHVAGSIHADAEARAPGWLARPDDVNALLTRLWSTNVDQERRRDAHRCRARGRRDRRRGRHARLRDRRGSTSALGPAPFATAFADWDVYYAAKSFVCTAVARWVAEEGLGVDVCTGGELAVALRAGVEPARIGLHGNNKSTAEIRAALEAGIGRIIVDSFDEIGRLSGLARGARRPAAGHGAGHHRASRPTPTPTSPPPTRTRSSGSRSRPGRLCGRCRPASTHPASS